MRPTVGVVLVLALAGCEGGGTDPVGGGDAATAGPDAAPGGPDAGPGDASPYCDPVEGTPVLELEVVAGNFDAPVAALAAPVPGDRRLFVVDKSARKIFIVEDGVTRPTPFLDLGALVFENSPSNERGLLALAFHPGYATNRRFFVHYTANDGANVVAEHLVSAGDANVAEPTGVPILVVPKLANNHNAGWIAFGPDGMLYVALGDDTEAAYAQDRTRLNGKILRLDVAQAGGYTVPPDNPFAGDGGGVRGEIWAFGLRNPWRNAFDRATGDLYVADVGGATREEISVIPAGSPGGVNLGWVTMEGSLCLGGAPACAGLQLPIYDYDHEGSNAAITGGFVYRGCAMPALQGTYFFADSFDRHFWSLRWDGAAGHTDLVAYPQFDGHSAYSFGEDQEGELLLLDGSEGKVYRIVPARP